MAETARDRAKRILTEGRLTVIRVDDKGIVARCKGDSGDEYMLGWDAEHTRWMCACEANAKFNRTCAHLRALWLVTIKPKERPS